MYGGNSAVHVSPFSARCVQAVQSPDEPSRHLFLLGTSDIRASNQFDLVEYVEDTGAMECRVSYQHANEIDSFAVKPDNAELVSVASTSARGEKSVALVRLPTAAMDETGNDDTQAYGQATKSEASHVCSFPVDQTSNVHSIEWDMHNNSQLCTMDSNKLRVWQVSESSASVVNLVDLKENFDTVPHKFSAGRAVWDVHNPDLLCFSLGPKVIGWDVRSNEAAFEIPQADGYYVRDIDCNPNKPSHLASCGDDRSVKIWDTRAIKEPIAVAAKHTHWAWTARYNPSHDQLLLSGGADGLVNLWRLSSASSAPLLIDEEDPANGEEQEKMDVCVRSYEEHEDSVYSLAWSKGDAWVFCSLSFDGRAMVNTVPSAEKYKILL